MYKKIRRQCAILKFQVTFQRLPPRHLVDFYKTEFLQITRICTSSLALERRSRVILASSDKTAKYIYIFRVPKPSLLRAQIRRYSCESKILMKIVSNYFIGFVNVFLISGNLIIGCRIDVTHPAKKKSKMSRCYHTLNVTVQLRLEYFFQLIESLRNSLA